MAESNIPKSCSTTKPLLRKESKIGPQPSGCSIRMPTKDASKSLSAHTPRETGKRATDARTGIAASRRSMTVSEADVIVVQKRVERLMGRNDMLKKKLETSREEVKLKKEQNRNTTNDLKAKIRIAKEKIAESIQECEFLESRGKHLEDEIKKKMVEVDQKNKNYEQEEMELERKLVKDKNELMRLGRMMNTIYKMTKELAQVMIGRLKKEREDNITWRMYSWVKGLWGKNRNQPPVAAVSC